MNLLLDTMAVIHLLQRPSALPQRALEAMEDPENRLFVSIASPWEMQIKAVLGKLPVLVPIATVIGKELDRGTFELLPVSLDHIGQLANLPTHHRDPFDRLLIAQAIHERMTLVSADEQIRRYNVPLLWA